MISIRVRPVIGSLSIVKHRHETTIAVRSTSNRDPAESSSDAASATSARSVIERPDRLERRAGSTLPTIRVERARPQPSAEPFIVAMLDGASASSSERSGRLQPARSASSLRRMIRRSGIAALGQRARRSRAGRSLIEIVRHRTRQRLDAAIWTRRDRLVDQPTDPSIWSWISLFISTAYSIGSSLTSGSMNPLTIRVEASASERPRLIR